MSAYIKPLNTKEPHPYRAPHQLSRPMKLAAGLVALGYADDEVASMSGLKPEHLKVVKRSHLFQTEVERMHKQYMEQHVSEIKDFIHAEVMPSLQVAKDIRDNEEQRAGDRLRAAEMFVDRVVPKKLETDSRQEIHIILEGKDMARFESVDAEFEELTGDTGTDIGCKDGTNSTSGNASGGLLPAPSQEAGGK